MAWKFGPIFVCHSDQCEKTNENTNSVYNVGLMKKQKYSATQGQWGTTLRF